MLSEETGQISDETSEVDENPSKAKKKDRRSIPAQFGSILRNVPITITWLCVQFAVKSTNIQITPFNLAKVFKTTLIKYILPYSITDN